MIGRKSHCGSSSRRGTEVAALFYSLLESAKLAGLEPKAYLREATFAALRGEKVPLPHELAASAAAECTGFYQSAYCELPGSAIADAGSCSASPDAGSDLRCPQYEICSPHAGTFPLGDCRTYAWSWFGPPATMLEAPILVASGREEGDRDAFNRALYPADADGGCALGYVPPLFLWCGGPVDGNDAIGSCHLSYASEGVSGSCGCPSTCHYGHCVLPCDADGSCPDAGVPTTCSNGFCYQSCQTTADCTASFMYYTCHNGLCLNPDVGP